MSRHPTEMPSGTSTTWMRWNSKISPTTLALVRHKIQRLTRTEEVLTKTHIIPEIIIVLRKEETWSRGVKIHRRIQAKSWTSWPCLITWETTVMKTFQSKIFLQALTTFRLPIMPISGTRFPLERNLWLIVYRTCNPSCPWLRRRTWSQRKGSMSVTSPTIFWILVWSGVAHTHDDRCRPRRLKDHG